MCHFIWKRRDTHIYSCRNSPSQPLVPNPNQWWYGLLNVMYCNLFRAIGGGHSGAMIHDAPSQSFSFKFMFSVTDPYGGSMQNSARPNKHSVPLNLISWLRARPIWPQEVEHSGWSVMPSAWEIIFKSFYFFHCMILLLIYPWNVKKFESLLYSC